MEGSIADVGADVEPAGAVLYAAEATTRSLTPVAAALVDDDVLDACSSELEGWCDSTTLSVVCFALSFPKLPRRTSSGAKYWS